jgi:predicted component of type VI protein secretion system
MDARIWLTGKGGEPRSFPIAAGRTVVGRDPEADISLEGDEAVSWNHLEIESRGGILMATDLDSRNGTALNGEPLDRPRRLRDGDTLTVGAHRLEVSDAAPGRGGETVAASRPAVELSEEERATAAALVAPYRSEGAFAGRPATRAEIAEALHVSERTAQRRLDALAAKLDVPGDAGRDRPRLIAARVIELGLDRAR